MLYSDKSDEELMGLYQQGSEDAFREIYSRHSGKIYGYLKNRSGSDQEARDLFQEVFVKIHKSKLLYKNVFPLLPWLFSVTHSVLVDAKRSHQRKNEIFDFDFGKIPIESNDPEVALNLTPLLEGLPANQKLALQLRYINEKTFEEIAASLKTSPLNARQIISRGVKNLKRLVSGVERHEK